MSKREQRRLDLQVASSILKALVFCPGSISQRLVLQNALSYRLLKRDSPDYILPTKEAIAQREILAGVTRASDENRLGQSGVVLATKHALSTAAVSANPSSSARGVAKLLDVHHRNISLAIVRREEIEDGCFLWTLSIRKRRTDGIPESVKTFVIKFWAKNTRVSPNRKDITTKHIGPG